MDEPILLGRIEREEDGTLRVLAPAVGLWSDAPAPGALLGPGSTFGRLLQLNRRFRLALPSGAVGRVGEGLPPRRIVAVEFGQLLFHLRPVGSGLSMDDAAAAPEPGRPAGADLPAGTRAVLSPTDGVFYRCPSPEEPPFVEVGQTIRRGQAVGLVEVMKTFNQIAYDGPEFPETAEVLEVRAADGYEVRAGQVLVVLR